MSHTVIVGAGIAGLTAAWLAVERRPDARVVVIEQAGEAGGLLRSLDYGEFGCFDCGVHVVTQTGVAELDGLYESLLPSGEWQVLEHQKRDLAGTWFRGRLQTNSHYLDLTRLPGEEYRRCLGDFFANLNARPPRTEDNLRGFVQRRFGSVIADEVIAPVVRKTYRRPLEEMDELAAHHVPLDRVILFDEAAFAPMLKVEMLREGIAFPEQRNFPLELGSGKRSLYPRRYGMYRVIDGLAALLARAGVDLMLDTTIARMARTGRRIDSVQLKRGGSSVDLGRVDRVIWTAGLMPLARALDIPFDLTADFDRPLTTVIVSVLTDRLPDWGGIYYFYCHQPGCLTFRVTNFTAYSSGAPRAGGYPLSLELLVDPASPETAEGYRARGVEELLSLGVLPEGARILFSRAEILAAGHPLPTRKNSLGMAKLRDAIGAAATENLTVGGIMAEPRLFFQVDVLVDLHKKLADWAG